MSTSWTTLQPGVLNDRAIAAANQDLFTSGFQQASIKQCCYEFRVGDQVIDLSSDEQKRILDLDEKGYFLIAPRCTVVVKLAEQIRLPKDCLARFLLKGKFFSVGIVPVNTYADPGFSGHMGAVLTNASNFYIRIGRDEPLVKAEFVKLPAPVDVGYQGQHGFHTGHWPVLQQYRARDDQVAQMGIVIGSHSENRRVYGEPIAEAIAKLRYYSIVVWIQLAFVTAALCAIIYFVDSIGGGWALALGIFGNLVATLLVAVARKWLPPKWRGEL